MNICVCFRDVLVMLEIILKNCGDYGLAIACRVGHERDQHDL